MNWHLIIPVALLTLGIFTTTYLLVPLNIRLAQKWKIVAQPSDRKIHTEARPEAGGLSFALPIVIAQLVMGFMLLNRLQGPMLLKLIGVEAIVLGLGLMDDRFELRPRYKLIWQTCIGILMYLIGFKVVSLTNPLGAEIVLGWASFPVTVIWYLVVLNAINLIDGIDGLAAGVCVIVCGVLFLVGLKETNFLVGSLSAFLLAGNLAFLRFNFPPAKIFLGDTGALFNGLIIAAVSTAGTQQYKGITTMTLLVPLAALAIPLIDISLAVFRRLRMGSIFSADKAHIHHAMLGLGLSQRAISLIVYVVTLLFGLIAIGFSFSSKKILFLVLLGLLILSVVIAYVLMRQGKKK